MGQRDWRLHPGVQAKLNGESGKKQPEPKTQEFEPIPMGTGVTVVEFQPDVHDDGAKEKFKNHANILDLYQRWFSPQEMRNATDVSCLTNCCNSTGHSHGDANPSMDLAQGSNTFICHGCGWQGDILDFAAVAAGIIQPGQRMTDAEDKTGLAVMHGCKEAFPDMQTGWTEDGQYRPTPPAPLVANTEDIAIELDEDEKEFQRIAAGRFAFDWRDFFAPGTPGYNWMTVLGGENTKPPDEFHFFNFLTMLGLICGKDVALEEEPNVYANLYTCVVGPPGMGKSLADGYAEDVLRREFPFDSSDPHKRGVNVIKGAGSGESLADSFHFTITQQPITPVAMGSNPPASANAKPQKVRVGGVTGYAKYGEFAQLVAKSSGKGSTLETTLQDLYDTAAAHCGGKSMGGGQYYADDYFCSVSSTTQIRRLRSLLAGDKVESGFVSRWVFVLGTMKPPKARFKPVHRSGLYSDARRIGMWADDIRSNHRGLIKLPGDFGSVQQYDEFIEQTCIPLELEPFLGRAALLYKKLVLLLAINNRELEVTEKTLLDAQKLWKYLIDCLRFVEGKVGTSEDTELEDRIQDIIEKEQDVSSQGYQYGPSFKKIKRALNRKDVNEYRIMQILKTKEALGLIRKVQDPRRGSRGIAKDAECYIVPR